MKANTRFLAFALRDAVIVAVVVLLWWWLGRSIWPPPMGDGLGFVLGLGVGLCTFLLHEWGHLLGALVSGATVHAPASLKSKSLFSFDSRRSTRAQFLLMSLGGFAVTAIALVFVYTALPMPSFASRVARGAVVLLATLTVVLEFPLFFWGLFSRRPPPVEAFPAPPESGSATTSPRSADPA